MARFIFGILATLLALPAISANTLRLPNWVCTVPDAIFVNAFENAEVVPNNPSGGNGGSYPGNQTRSVFLPDFGTHNYYLYLPNNYTPLRAWPLLLALHGAAGPGLADNAAQILRNDWSVIADTQGFIVVAPIASGSMGGWTAPSSSSDHPSDYDVFAAVLADVESAYNIERTRRYGWGFSAGGFVMHDIMLNGFNSVVNADSLAAYAVDGATLSFACPNATQCDQLLNQTSRRIPLDIHIGTSDPRLASAQDDHNRFLTHGWIDAQSIFYTQFAGGHTYAGQLASAWSSLCAFALLP